MANDRTYPRSGRSRAVSLGFGDSASPAELARAYLYRGELAVRTGDAALARSSLTAAESISLSADERTALEDEFAALAEQVGRD